VTVVLEEASLKTGTDPVPKWYNGKRSKMCMSLDEKHKFTAIICIISSYMFAYVGWKTLRKKQVQLITN